ncbi:rhoptry family protein [Ureaplasma canigenitalium]|uniref:GA module-containing protein n=1 Tax=Ureaplasma canigenitalium TaxID=42092 RepID=UPI0004E24C11|nr:GA module-containing protein [Ureaplasma canigenitalium]
MENNNNNNNKRQKKKIALGFGLAGGSLVTAAIALAIVYLKPKEKNNVEPFKPLPNPNLSTDESKEKVVPDEPENNDDGSNLQPEKDREKELKAKQQNYKHLFDELKTITNIIIDDELRKEALDFINDQKHNEFNDENQHELNLLLSDIKAKSFEEEKVINQLINQLKSTTLKSKLRDELGKSKTFKDRLNVKEKTDALLKLQPVVLSLIEKIKDPSKKNSFRRQYDFDVNNIDDVKNLMNELAKQEAYEAIARLDINSNDKRKLEERFILAKDYDTLKNITKDANQLFDDEKQKINNLINSLNNNETKNKLISQLNNADKLTDLSKINDQINDEKIIEEFDQKSKTDTPNINKKEIEILIDHIFDDEKKNELKEKLKNASTNDELRKIVDDAYEQIRKGDANGQHGDENLLRAIKNLLKSRVNNSNLSPDEINDLLKQIENAESIEALKPIEHDFNRKNTISKLKEEAKKAINQLNDGELKDKLTKLLNKDNVRATELDLIIKAAKEIIKKDKEASSDTLDKVKDPKVHDQFKEQLDNARTQEEINQIISNINDYVNKHNNLKDKTLDALNKLEDSNQIKSDNKDNANSLSTSDDEYLNIINKVDEYLNNLKKETNDAINKLEGDNQFDELKKKLDTNDLTESNLKILKEDALNIFNKKKEDEKTKITNSGLDSDLQNHLNNDVNNANNLNELGVIDNKIKTLDVIKKINDETTKNDLINKVKNINVNEPDANKKLDEIRKQARTKVANESGDIIEIAKSKVLNLPYPKQENAPAVKELIKQLDDVKNNSQLSEEDKRKKAKEIEDLLPSLTVEIEKAKSEIKKVSDIHHKELNNKLDETGFTSTSNNKEKFDTLNKLIDEKKKSDKANGVQSVNGLSNLSQDEKNHFNNQINSSSTDNNTKILEIVKQARLKDKKNALIKKLNSIGYPGGATAPAISTLASEINSLTNMNSADQFDSKIGQLKNKVTEVKNQINSIDGKFNLTKQRLINQLNSADSETKLNQVFADISKLKEIIEKVNIISNINDNVDQEHENTIDDQKSLNQAINSLKEELYKKIDSIENNQQLDSTKNLVDKTISAYTTLKDRFGNKAISVMKNFINEVKSKVNDNNGLSEIDSILTKSNEFKKELDKWWSPAAGKDIGLYIKKNKTYLSNNNHNASDVNHIVDNQTFKTYEEMIRLIKNTADPDVIKNLNDRGYIHHALIDYLKLPQNDTQHLTDAVKNEFKKRILKATHRRDIDTVKNEAKQFNRIASEAKAILNSFGEDSNRTEMKTLINNAASVNDITNAKNVIEEYKRQYEETKKQLDQYEADDNKNDGIIENLKRELNTVTNKEAAVSLRTKINFAKEKAAAVASIKTLTHLKQGENDLHLGGFILKINNANTSEMINQFKNEAILQDKKEAAFSYVDQLTHLSPT